MNYRLQLLLKDRQLTSSRFAEIVGIQPSAVSHLISGRNKPGFDILAKILTNFPEVNPRWLILGEEPVYLQSEMPDTLNKVVEPPAALIDNSSPNVVTSDSLFPTIEQEPGSGKINSLNDKKGFEDMEFPVKTGDNNTSADMDIKPAQLPVSIDPEKIIVLYGDGTFDSFIHKKK